ncbi:MAG: hypothetical protein RL685_6806, partial [Pseudomonadota bacterium]
MDALWRSAFERGGQAWPTVKLGYERFRERLTQLGHAADSLPEYSEAVYACAASALGEDAACRAIEERHFGGLRSAIARVDGRKDFIDEVVQMLRVHLFSGEAPKIQSYTGRGPLDRWLRTVAMRLAFRQKKARARLRSGEPEEQVLAGSPTFASRRDGGEEPFKALYARTFEHALEE